MHTCTCKGCGLCVVESIPCTIIGVFHLYLNCRFSDYLQHDVLSNNSMASMKPHPNNNKTSIAETAKIENCTFKINFYFSEPTTFGYKVTLLVISHKIKPERDCLCYLPTSAVEYALPHRSTPTQMKYQHWDQLSDSNKKHASLTSYNIFLSNSQRAPIGPTASQDWGKVSLLITYIYVSACLIFQWEHLDTVISF